MEYCSGEERFRTPYGAVETGQPVTFSLRCNNGEQDWEASLLYTIESTGQEGEVSLQRQGEWLTGTFPGTEAIGPVWYTFLLRRRGEIQGFFCPKQGRLTGPAVLEREDCRRYQLTVYSRRQNTPDWYGQGVTYHIFADRFARKGEATQLPRRILHENWLDTPEYRPDEHGEILNNDFFGGNLQGIQEKLPYLESLGVETLFLSPIFEAASNHRYDTGDYKKIDPMLGTEEDFCNLCAEAKKYGIRIILDGVFNHTGNDSRYFNARGHYDSIGAAQSLDSPYAGWYSFSHWPDQYSSWWGIYTLPQVNEDNPDYQHFILEDEDSVVRRWLRLGAAGWRLDVADELPDSFIARLRDAARGEKEDAVIIGEVWEDASNKISYDCRRKYLLGDGLDGVMNYPFKDALLHYLSCGGAEVFRDRMEQLRENYPPTAFFSCMNGLSTHDTPRVLSVLGLAGESPPHTRESRAVHRLTSVQYERAVQLLKLGSLIQYAFPGSPCLYYGDEAGMEGLEDPFNRRCYPWGRENLSLVDWYRRLGQLRKNHPALRKGSLRFLYAQGDVLCFCRQTEEESMLITVNRGMMPQGLELDWNGESGVDCLTGRPASVCAGKLYLELPPLCGRIFRS